MTNKHLVTSKNSHDKSGEFLEVTIYASIHTKQCTLYTVEILKHFFMKAGKLFIQADNSVSFRFTVLLLREQLLHSSH